MKKISYTHEIVQQKVSYSPNDEIIGSIQKSENRIFEIKAGNGYGKTFILDLIAYAMGLHHKSELDVHENSRTLVELKDRISRYDDIESYRLSYEIELPIDSSVSLILKKDENQASDLSHIEIDNKVYGIDNLHSKINVLYDIPTTPTKRLDSIVKDLIDWNSDLINKSDRLSMRFNELSRSVKQVRDDKRIEDERKKIEDYNQSNSEIQKRLTKLEQYLKLAEKKELIVDFTNARKAQDSNLDALSKCERELRELGGTRKMSPYKNERTIKGLRDQIQSSSSEWFDHCRSLILIINKYPELLAEVNKRKDLHTTYSELSSPKIPRDRPEFEKKLETFLQCLHDEVTTIEKKSDRQVYEILSTIKEQLESLEHLNRQDIVEQIAGFNFLDLKNSLDRVLVKVHITDFKPIKSKMTSYMGSVKRILSEYQRASNALSKEQEKQKRSENDLLIEKLDSRKRRLKKQVTDDENLLKKIESKLSQYDVFIQSKPVREIEKMISAISTQLGNYNSFSSGEISNLINKTRAEIQNNEDKISLSQRKIDTEEGKEKNIYSAKQIEKIDALKRQLGLLKRNIQEFSSLLKNPKSDKNLHEEDRKFIDLIGEQIAKTMGSKLLLKDQEYVHLKSYDLVKQEFNLIDGRIIKRDDLSTGLASANYLKQRIRNLSGDYSVVLLDEIGNMDPKTLKEVINEIKDLENQGKLLIALLTQPIEEGVEVIEY